MEELIITIGVGIIIIIILTVFLFPLTLIAKPSGLVGVIVGTILCFTAYSVIEISTLPTLTGNTGMVIGIPMIFIGGIFLFSEWKGE